MNGLKRSATALNGFKLLSLAALLAAAATGCFTSAPPPARAWTIVLKGTPAAAARPLAGEPIGSVRLGTVSVLAPCDAREITVRRADGTLARDPYNVFISPPAVLLRAPVLALLAADGRFGRVLDGASSASPAAVIELTVTELALDAAAKPRTARASVAVNVVRSVRGVRTVVLSGGGSAAADASGKDFSAAFSAAFSDAVRAALAELK